MRFPILAAALVVPALAACSPGGTGDPVTPASEPAAEPATDAGDSTCGADKLGRWLNVLPTEDMKAEIAAAVGERRIRYYTQGDPITLDFNPARLNVELGEDGRIKLFRCG